MSREVPRFVPQLKTKKPASWLIFDAKVGDSEGIYVIPQLYCLHIADVFPGEFANSSGVLHVS